MRLLRLRLAMTAAAFVAVTTTLPATVAAQETIEYYGMDAIGSVRIVFDASGAVKGRMDYGPFGEPLSPSSGIGQNVFAQISI